MPCSPSDTASALKIVPLEDFVNNLAVSQAVFQAQNIEEVNKRLKDKAIASHREAKGFPKKSLKL